MSAVTRMRELLRLDGSEQALLAAVAHALPTIDGELFSICARYTLAEGRISPGALATRGQQSFEKLAAAFDCTADAPPSFMGVDSPLTSTTQANSWNEGAMLAAQVSGCADFVGAFMDLGAGRFAAAGAGTAQRTPSPRQELRVYQAIHGLLAINLRVRDALGGASALEHADGVFEADGTPVELHDATLRDHGARRDLSALVRARERDHDFEPLAEANALMHWNELTRGHYVLLDHVDTDRRRYVIAYRLPPCAPLLSHALTERERAVLERILVGARNKAIASDLDVSRSHVTGISKRALDKLGVRSAAELARVVRARSSLVFGELQAHGESLIALGYSEPTADALGQLTNAERHVARAVLEGRSQREIALERGVSERTIASQVANVYRKLSVSGRRELTAKIAR
jgi:DNA-binding NarL/FixJ family response regulator